MKNIILSIVFIIFLNFYYLFSIDKSVERLFCIKFISFNRVYEIYFSKKPVGYYKYKENLDGVEIYFTYEGKEFWEQSKFDENFTILEKFIPTNMYTNGKGESMRFKKKFSPVIEKNRLRKKYPYGYGRN
ncbi:MAG TPA: hypothetical protein PLE45_05565 [Spirochaetota bacterium]|nr:hypothetical protein [Spirochaetota bacterium]HOL56531.1 hypothetical protein [Spirochaetota bacterium]HPP03631.1 hypothetical protein [Spirochaetota bacterium]